MTRNIWFALIAGLFLFVLFVGVGALSPTRDLDARSIQGIAASGAFNRMEGSYATMAFLFSITSPVTRLLFATASGLCFIFYCIRHLRTNYSLPIFAFLVFSPIVFVLTQFNKDIVLVWFVIATALTMLSNLSRYAKLLAVAFIYVVYGYLFREYYYLIFAVFLGLCFARSWPFGARVYAVLLALVLIAFAPSEVFSQLQGPRDIVNIDRVGRDVVGARTAFVNLERPDDYVSFLKNYAYAAVRLNLPFLFGGRLQELFLFVNVLIYLGLLISGGFARRVFGNIRARLPKGDVLWNAQTSALLFGAHIVVLICFEPDLGSYLRHMSSALPYLVPVLIAFDRAIPLWLVQRRAPQWRHEQRRRRAAVG